MGWGKEMHADPDIISIGPWLAPTLVSDTTTGEAKVIPIRPGILNRPEGRKRMPRKHLWLAGICWMVVALL